MSTRSPRGTPENWTDIVSKRQRLHHTSLKTPSLGEVGKVEVSYHLSGFLGDLLRAATLVRRGAGWPFFGPTTGDQTIGMVKNRGVNSEKIIIRTTEDLMVFEDRLLTEGQILTDCPAAYLSITRRILSDGRN